MNIIKFNNFQSRDTKRSISTGRFYNDKTISSEKRGIEDDVAQGKLNKLSPYHIHDGIKIDKNKDISFATVESNSELMKSRSSINRYVFYYIND